MMSDFNKILSVGSPQRLLSPPKLLWKSNFSKMPKMDRKWKKMDFFKTLDYSSMHLNSHFSHLMLSDLDKI